MRMKPNIFVFAVPLTREAAGWVCCCLNQPRQNSFSKTRSGVPQERTLEVCRNHLKVLRYSEPQLTKTSSRNMQCMSGERKMAIRRFSLSECTKTVFVTFYNQRTEALLPRGLQMQLERFVFLTSQAASGEPADLFYFFPCFVRVIL